MPPVLYILFEDCIKAGGIFCFSIYEGASCVFDFRHEERPLSGCLSTTKPKTKRFWPVDDLDQKLHHAGDSLNIHFIISALMEGYGPPPPFIITKRDS